MGAGGLRLRLHSGPWPGPQSPSFTAKPVVLAAHPYTSVAVPLSGPAPAPPAGRSAGAQGSSALDTEADALSGSFTASFSDLEGGSAGSCPGRGGQRVWGCGPVGRVGRAWLPTHSPRGGGGASCVIHECLNVASGFAAQPSSPGARHLCWLAYSSIIPAFFFSSKEAPPWIKKRQSRRLELPTTLGPHTPSPMHSFSYTATDCSLSGSDGQAPPSPAVAGAKLWSAQVRDLRGLPARPHFG